MTTISWSRQQRKQWRQARALAELVADGILQVDENAGERSVVAVGAIVEELEKFSWDAEAMIAAQVAAAETEATLEAHKTKAREERMRDAALERGCVVCGSEVSMDRFGRWITGHSGPFCSDECRNRFYRLGLREIVGQGSE